MLLALSGRIIVALRSCTLWAYPIGAGAEKEQKGGTKTTPKAYRPPDIKNSRLGAAMHVLRCVTEAVITRAVDNVCPRARIHSRALELTPLHPCHVTITNVTLFRVYIPLVCFVATAVGTQAFVITLLLRPLVAPPPLA